MKKNCLDCGVCDSCIERSIAVADEFEADNTDELIEAARGVVNVEGDTDMGGV